MDRANQDVDGENCVRNDAGELVRTDKDKMKAWVKHCLLSNFSGQAMSSLRILQLLHTPPHPQCVRNLDMWSTQQNEMHQGYWPIIIEMLNAVGEEGVELARQLTEAVLSCHVIPSDWEERSILNLCKGKRESLGHGNYGGLKQVMKLLEWVADLRRCKTVNIDEMQLGFVPGRGSTDTISIIRLLQEK